jgi:hypothetical protein
VTSVDEMLTDAPVMKLVPVRVTGTVAPCAPLGGARAVRVGVLPPETVKVAAPLVPYGVVTLMLRAPTVALEAMVRVAVICEKLTTVTLLTVTPVEEMLTVAPGTKLVPVRVTGTVAPCVPLDGAIVVRAGELATVKTTGALVPPGVVTVTFRGPVVAFEAIAI